MALKTFSFIPSTVDPGIYTKVESSTSWIFVSVSNDDFFCSYHHLASFQSLCSHLSTIWDINISQSSELKYLNLRIIQSSFGISVDQTSHIIEILRSYFGSPDLLKTVETPFRTDSDFERDLFDSFPATPSELLKLQI